RIPGRYGTHSQAPGVRCFRHAHPVPKLSAPPRALHTRQALFSFRQSDSSDRPVGPRATARKPWRQCGFEKPRTFTETPFLILAPIVFFLWLLCRGRDRAKLCLLLTASLVFYGYHHWSLLFLILAYCLVDWCVGLRIERARNPGLVLAGGLTFNLAV